jgi:hypothetical protein
MHKIWIDFLTHAPCVFVQCGEKNYQELGGEIAPNNLLRIRRISTSGGVHD